MCERIEIKCKVFLINSMPYHTRINLTSQMLINKCNMKNKFKLLSNILSIFKHLLFIHLDYVRMNAITLDSEFNWKSEKKRGKCFL